MALRLRELAIWTVLAVLGLCIPGLNSQDSSEAWDSEKYQEEAEQTFELIFHKYHRWVRPPVEYVNVTVELTVERMKYLDVMKEELQTVVSMELTWFDERLIWSPIRVHQIMSNTSVVWTPDLVFINSIAPSKSLLPQIVRIKKDGYVAWTRKEVVTTSCETELEAEKQTCHLKFGFMSNIQERQSDRFLDQDNSKLFSSGDLKTHEWELDTESLHFETDNDTVLPFEMDVEMTVQRPESYSTGRASEKAASSTNSGCSNSAQHGQRFFAQTRSPSELLFILLIGVMYHFLYLSVRSLA